MKPATPPKALIFDLDDTLVDSNGAYARGLVKIGIDPDGEEFRSARKRAKSKIHDVATAVPHVSSRNRLLYFKELLTARGTYGHAALIDLVARYEMAVCEDMARQWRALKRESLFDRITARFPIAVVSNETTRMQTLKCAAIDPQTRWFKTLITSEEIGVEKPNPKGFLLAASLLGVKPEECWMIGDSHAMDMVSGSGLGMTTVWSQEFAPQKLAKTDFCSYCIENLDSLATLLGL